MWWENQAPHIRKLHSYSLSSRSCPALSTLTPWTSVVFFYLTSIKPEQRERTGYSVPGTVLRASCVQTHLFHTTSLWNLFSSLSPFYKQRVWSTQITHSKSYRSWVEEPGPHGAPEVWLHSFCSDIFRCQILAEMASFLSIKPPHVGAAEGVLLHCLTCNTSAPGRNRDPHSVHLQNLKTNPWIQNPTTVSPVRIFRVSWATWQKFKIYRNKSNVRPPALTNLTR